MSYLLLNTTLEKYRFVSCMYIDPDIQAYAKMNKNITDAGTDKGLFWGSLDSLRKNSVKLDIVHVATTLHRQATLLLGLPCHVVTC